MTEWKLIDDQTPKDRPLLGCDIDDEYLPFSMVWDEQYGWRDPHWDGTYAPTHWMERPAPPAPME